jgi:hypothetical protein
MREDDMKTKATFHDSQSGGAALVALMVLSLLTIMGLSGARTASVELEIAGNDAVNKRNFFSAEASRAFVMTNTDLYGVDNIDNATPHFFPVGAAPNDDPTDPNNVVPFNLGNNQSFDGSVQYTSATLPPRGSGNDVTSGMRAHRYTMTCTGSGPRNTTKGIRAGFYRLGL